MHDLDRTQLEIGDALESGFDAGESDFEDTLEFPDGEFDGESVMDEAMEMEMAAELLSVTSEHELDQFIGNLFKKAVSGARSFMRSSAGRALGGMLKGLAKKALPIAGTALGTFVGGPLGATIGGKLGSLGAGLIKEVDLEGIAPDEREFEIARRIVQLGANAAQRLASIPPTANPVVTARQVLADAVRQVTPVLSGTTAQGYARPGTTPTSYIGAGRHGRPRTGRWVRAGRNIIVLRA